MSDAQFGLLTAVFLWVYGLLSPIGGYLADRLNRSRVIIFSLFVWSAVTWLTAHVTTYNGLLLTRALMGVSEACYIPAALALITDYHSPRTRSLAVGIHMVGVIGGQALGFTGGLLAENHSWNYPFQLFGIAGVVYALILALILKDRKDKKLKEKVNSDIGFTTAIHNLFRKKGFWLALLFWSLFGVSGWLIIGWLPTFYKEQFSLSQTTAGLYATGYLYSASMIGVLVGGFLADKWSRINSRARLLVPALGMIAAAPGIAMAASTDWVGLAVAGFLFYAFFKSFADSNMMPILCMVVDERFRATGYGILNLFSCIIGGIGLYAGGYLRDQNVNLSQMFLVASGVAFASGVVLLFIRERERSMHS